MKVIQSLQTIRKPSSILDIKMELLLTDEGSSGPLPSCQDGRVQLEQIIPSTLLLKISCKSYLNLSKSTTWISGFVSRILQQNNFNKFPEIKLFSRINSEVMKWTSTRTIDRWENPRAKRQRNQANGQTIQSRKRTQWASITKKEATKCVRQWQVQVGKARYGKGNRRKRRPTNLRRSRADQRRSETTV